MKNKESRCNFFRCLCLKIYIAFSEFLKNNILLSYLQLNAKVEKNNKSLGPHKLRGNEGQRELHNLSGVMGGWQNKV